MIPNKKFYYNVTLPADLADVAANLMYQADDSMVLWVGFRAQVAGDVIEESFPVNGSADQADATIESAVLPRLRALYLGAPTEAADVKAEAKNVRSSKVK